MRLNTKNARTGHPQFRNGKEKTKSESVGHPPVPYAVFGDPQSLNLYTYVRNDPVSRADPDGHCIGAFGQSTMSCYPASGAISFEQGPEAPQQPSISNTPPPPAQNKPGFWHRLGQHFSNLFHGRAWNYTRELKEVVTSTILPAEPRPAVTYANDAAGLVGLVAGERAGRVIGPLGAAVSITNNREPSNIFFSVFGAIPGPDVPMAITTGFSDALEYEIYNNDPLAGKTWQNEHFFDSPSGSGSGPAPSYDSVPHDGGGGSSVSPEECQMTGFC